METIELLSDPRVRALLDEAARRGAQAAIDDLVLYTMEATDNPRIDWFESML